MSLRNCKGGFSSRARRSDRRGVVTVEFMLVATPFLVLILGAIEIGMIALSSATLRNGVHDAARIVRTNSEGCVTQERIEELVCENTMFAPGCAERLEATRRVLNDGWSSTGADFVGQADDEDNNQAAGGNVVVVTAVYPWRTVSPLIGVIMGDENGELRFNQRFVFQTEPFGDAACTAG